MGEMNAVVPVVTVKLLVCVLEHVSTLKGCSLDPISLSRDARNGRCLYI